MEGGDELSVLAEIAVALAGFSGIVIAVQSRDQVHPWDTFRAVLLLITGFSTRVQALLPSAIHSFGVAGPSLWRLSSALCLLINLAPIIPVFRGRPADIASSAYYRQNVAVTMTGSAVTVAAHLMNALALGTVGTFSLFYLGVLMHIPSTALQFLIVIVVRPRD